MPLPSHIKYEAKLRPFWITQNTENFETNCNGLYIRNAGGTAYIDFDGEEIGLFTNMDLPLFECPPEVLITTPLKIRFVQQTVTNQILILKKTLIPVL